MYALWALIVILFLYIGRAILGPSIWDRLLVMSVMSTKIIIMIVIFASVRGNAYLLDFAILYALFGFISTIFLALFLSERSLRKKE